MRKLGLLLLISSLVVTLSGCSGRVVGRDAVTPVSGVIISGTRQGISPIVNVETKVVQKGKDFVELLKNGDHSAAFDQIIVEDKTFITVDSFSEWVGTLDLSGEFTYNEYTVNQVKFVDCVSPAVTFSLELQLDEAGTGWNILMDDFYVTNFEVRVPDGIPCRLDGVDLSPYKQSELKNNLAVYKIPAIVNASHTLEMDTIFESGITLDISNTNMPVDASTALYVRDAALRDSLISTCSGALVSLNNIMVNYDWDTFCRYFAPTVQTSAYATAFDTGHENKSAVYGLELTHVRNLGRSDMEVHYTGYNTVSVHFGTRWKWSSDYRVKDNVVTVKNWSDMHMENTMELYSDGSIYLIQSIDEDSLVRLTNGLEQWL